jgi:quercetin dioxygenase-like cupin family protein
MLDHVRRDPAARKASTRGLFEGNVSSQVLSENPQTRVSEVAFSDGGRTKWHTHTFHQVLVITEGQGIVADEQQELRVTPGDVVYVQPGTRHWHGSEPGGSMAHLSINGPGDTSW